MFHGDGRNTLQLAHLFASHQTKVGMNELPSVKLTWPLKMEGWKMNVLLGVLGLFSGAIAVSFRDGTTHHP